MELQELRDSPSWEWPRNAGEVLRGILKDRNRGIPDRVVAAGLCGDLVVMNDRMAELLLSVLGNAEEPEELRAKAAIALGPVAEQMDTEFDEEFEDQFDEPPITRAVFARILEALRATYGDAGAPKLVRRRALEASVRAPRDWHPEAIRTAYGDKDDDWKLTAVFAMQYVRGFDQQIVEMLEHPNLDTQREAVRAAGNWGLAAAWPRVQGWLESESTPKPLLLAAIEAAPGVNAEEPEETLAELADSSDEDIAEAATEAMSWGELLSDEEEEED